MILAFKLKRITADGATKENGGHEQKPSEDVQTENVNTDGDEEKEVQKAGVYTETAQCDGIELAKENFAAMKDNKDVVLREDLKSAFEKFGTVKVSASPDFFFFRSLIYFGGFVYMTCIIPYCPIFFNVLHHHWY